jgi:hypothetical protein
MLGYVDMRKAVPVTFSVVRIRIIWILQGMIKLALFNPDQEYFHSALNIVRDRNLRVSADLLVSPLVYLFPVWHLDKFCYIANDRGEEVSLPSQLELTP